MSKWWRGGLRWVSIIGLVALGALAGLFTGGPIWAWVLAGAAVAFLVDVATQSALAVHGGWWGRPGPEDATRHLTRTS
ncbi:MAG: DUF4175 domain-containing protein [Cellulomonadaceae bacterium]|nr:DUF4175 domain-containing protein [Cellulomonadaceae bacterium]